MNGLGAAGIALALTCTPIAAMARDDGYISDDEKTLISDALANQARERERQKHIRVIRRATRKASDRYIATFDEKAFASRRAFEAFVTKTIPKEIAYQIIDGPSFIVFMRGPERSIAPLLRLKAIEFIEEDELYELALPRAKPD